MALSSYFLVVFDHKDRANVEAGFLYFIITHIATLAIIILFFLLYHATGSFDFDVWRNGLAHLSPLLAAVIFVLTVVGFGTKAGIIPLHIWLPAAHPAAPSQVSALMSGVMIKTGIYMLIRVLFDFFGNTPQWFGLTILLLGALSSILGVLYALGEHDIKRLLAYHSIENIGIILLGLGAALVFRSMGENTFALLALAATLFHTANHAIFKSLLFMSAGSVVLATHTRNIEEYGGLIKRMPETALFFLIGSIAISGLVPFNGFVSEWLTFQSLFAGIHAMSVTTKVIMVGGIAALAFTGGLAAACFVKAFGITFLARPRSKEAEHAEEASSGMRISMAILALITLAMGIFGGTMAKIFMSVANIFPSLTYSFPPAVLYREELSLTNGFGQLHMPLLFIALLIALLVTWFISNLSKEKQKVAVGITWDCGFPLTKRMEITATAFSRSIVTIFGSVLRPEMHVEREYLDPEKKHFVRSITVSGHLRDIYRIYAYDPIAHMTLRFGTYVSKIQSGSTHIYLAYMMIVLVALIYFATH
jgi:hydrogenase-4 component B